MKPLKTLNAGVTDSEQSNETSISNSTATTPRSTHTNIPISAASDIPLKTLNAGVTDREQSNETSISNSTATTPRSTHTNIPISAASDIRIIQNFCVIWLDNSINEVNNDDSINTITELRQVVNSVNKFTDVDECIDFIATIEDEKAFVIISELLSQQLIPNIHDLPQVDIIYIFGKNKSQYENWKKEWIKIEGIHADIKSIYQALQLATKQCNQDSIAMSFIPVSEEVSSQNLDQLEPSFMYTQIFKEILLEMEHDEQSIKDLANYCRKFYHDNIRELTIIYEFEHNYLSKSPIGWYKSECFVYQMLNRALRMLEGDTMINMGFFIRDLHQQIQELYQKQVSTYDRKSFTVYRGQVLLKTDFEKLMKSKNGLMSFNNFLSTSTEREVSLGFAKRALTRTNMIGILFEMTIDPSVPSTPFASIREVSYYQPGEEILFSMHTVFRIGEINKIDNNNSLYQVDLKLTADDDQQLRTLTERIREEVEDVTGWQRLGDLLITIGHFNKAEELYNVLLEQASNEDEKALYYHQLGCIKEDQGDYEKSIHYYKKALEIDQKTLPPNHPDLTNSYNSIGKMYRNMGQYSKALSFYIKALEIDQKTLPPNHPDIATSYNNIGKVYRNMGEYSKALSFYEKALEVRQKFLPPNHLDFCTSYNNIGALYYNMREYSEALSFYEQALEIRQKTLPPNHPSLVTSYNNIGEVYRSMVEYLKALSFYEKALEIRQKTLPPNHPDLATSYNNIGTLHYNMGEYSKALLSYELAQDILQRSLPPNHPHAQSVRNSIEIVKTKLFTYL